MNRNWIAAIVAAALVLGGVITAPSQELPREPNAFMQLKLKNAQAVLDGIAVRDFARIEEGADNLVRLSMKTEFQMKGVPDYERYAGEFRRTATDLVQKSKDKNLDGAALAYVQLTLNCVQCHRHIREAK